VTRHLARRYRPPPPGPRSRPGHRSGPGGPRRRRRVRGGPVRGSPRWRPGRGLSRRAYCRSPRTPVVCRRPGTPPARPGVGVRPQDPRSGLHDGEIRRLLPRAQDRVRRQPRVIGEQELADVLHRWQVDRRPVGVDRPPNSAFQFWASGSFSTIGQKFGYRWGMATSSATDCATNCDMWVARRTSHPSAATATVSDCAGDESRGTRPSLPRQAATEARQPPGA
jgi:hypothetical protein